MAKSSKKSLILIALTLALGLGLVGCGKGLEVNNNINQNQNANVNYSAWITYQDKFYGFELKYPKEWGENWEGKVSILNSGYELCFKSKFYLDEELKTISMSTASIFCISRISKKRWDEQQDKNSLGRLLSESNGYILYLPPRETLNNFALTPAPTAEKIEEILSTFKLIDQGFSTTDDNAPISIILGKDGWKTYTNKYWGIRFKFEDKDNEILLQPPSGVNDMDIEFYKPGETIEEDLNISIGKYDIPKDYYNNLEKYISEGQGWFIGQNDQKLIFLEKLNYPNIEKIYKVKVEVCDYYCDKTKPKKYVDRIFMNYFNEPSQYLYIGSYNNPIIQQILSTFEFLNK